MPTRCVGLPLLSGQRWWTWPAASAPGSACHTGPGGGGQGVRCGVSMLIQQHREKRERPAGGPTLKMTSGTADTGAAALSEPCWASEPDCCSAFSALLVDAAGAEASAMSAMAVKCSASHEGRGCNEEDEGGRQSRESGREIRVLCFCSCNHFPASGTHACVHMKTRGLLGSLSRFLTALHPS